MNFSFFKESSNENLWPDFIMLFLKNRLDAGEYFVAAET